MKVREVIANCTDELQEKTMDMKSVKSSNIHSIGYDPEKRVLAVRFGAADGDVWHYEGVSPEQHAALISAESVGKHFHSNIRTAFKGRRA